MTDKPTTAAGYEDGQTEFVRATCLYVATKLGDMMDDLHLAFEDRRRVTLEGRTIREEKAARDVWVCGPGAYVVLKSLALRKRGENKDAYDLYYVVRNYGTTIDDVASSLKSLLHDPSAEEALDILEQDFGKHDCIGPLRAAEFLTNGPDAEIQADVVGFVRQLLERCR